MSTRRWKTALIRGGLFLMGLALLSPGLGSLIRGHLFYQAYWGGAAFSPIVGLIGILVICFAIFGDLEKIAIKKKRKL